MPLTKNHHSLLYANPMTINERPHIKYDWTIGKRLKFSCTVYYVKQFDALRRRCGVEDGFVRSMVKCGPCPDQFDRDMLVNEASSAFPVTTFSLSELSS
jgi:hypothetical protein